MDIRRSESEETVVGLVGVGVDLVVGVGMDKALEVVVMETAAVS